MSGIELTATLQNLYLGLVLLYLLLDGLNVLLGFRLTATKPLLESEQREGQVRTTERIECLCVCHYI